MPSTFTEKNPKEREAAPISYRRDWGGNKGVGPREFMRGKKE